MDGPNNVGRNREKRGRQAGRWHLRSRHLFVTWPQLSVGPPSLDEVRRLIVGNIGEWTIAVPSRPPLTGGVLAREQHEDGTWHLHGLFEFADQFDSSDPRCLDFIYEGVNKHPNIQGCRSVKAVKRYCQKEGSFLVWGTISSFSRTFADVSADLLAAEPAKRKKVLAEIVSKNPQYLVHVNKFVTSIQTHEYLTERPWKVRQLRVYWLYGRSGSGKSYFANHYWPYSYRPPLTGKFWDGYWNHASVIYDDFSPSQLQYRELLRVTDVYGCRLEIKGGMSCARYSVVVFTTTDPPEAAYHNAYDEQLARRITAAVDFGDAYSKLAFRRKVRSQLGLGPDSESETDECLDDDDKSGAE